MFDCTFVSRCRREGQGERARGLSLKEISISKVLDLDGGLDLLKDETFHELTVVKSELMDEFEIITFSMKVGEVSPVFNTPHGFHLAKVTERKTGEPKPFEDVRQLIKEELTAQKQDEKLQQFVDELKKSAKIEYIEPEDSTESHSGH